MNSHEVMEGGGKQKLSFIQDGIAEKFRNITFSVRKPTVSLFPFLNECFYFMERTDYSLLGFKTIQWNFNLLYGLPGETLFLFMF